MAKPKKKAFEIDSEELSSSDSDFEQYCFVAAPLPQFIL